MKNKNFRNNIQQAKEIFEANSISINKKPFFLERLDKYNIIVYELKKSKEGNLNKANISYYGTLLYALRDLYRRVTKRNPKEGVFEEYREYTATQSTKSNQKEITTRFNKAVKSKGKK